MLVYSVKIKLLMLLEPVLVRALQVPLNVGTLKVNQTPHGNSLSHRVPGSIGQCQDPGKVFKGKKMAGHLGNVRKTVQNLTVVKVDVENQYVLIKGATWL